MDNLEIRQLAKSMAKDIQNIVDSYNRLDLGFKFYPKVKKIEVETAACKPIVSFSVDVEVIYNTNQD